MKAVKFSQCNFVWRGWDHTGDGEPGGQGVPPKVYDLPVYCTDQDQSLSCWKMSFWDRLRVLLTGRVWLWVCGQHPPVSVEAKRPGGLA